MCTDMSKTAKKKRKTKKNCEEGYSVDKGERKTWWWDEGPIIQNLPVPRAWAQSEAEEGWPGWGQAAVLFWAQGAKEGEAKNAGLHKLEKSKVWPLNSPLCFVCSTKHGVKTRKTYRQGYKVRKSLSYRNRAKCLVFIYDIAVPSSVWPIKTAVSYGSA